jgi:hypothetical protein
MSEFLRLLENEIQIAALSFLVLVYTLRVLWLLRFKKAQDMTSPAGSPTRGIAYSMMNIAMPWAMESVRRRPGFYAQFVIFHLGVTAAIAATFIIPYRPRLFEIKAVAFIFQAAMGSACGVGLMRLYRRVANPAVRLISTPDDYFSLILMILYFAAGFLAVPNRYQAAEWSLILFFGLTAFFLVYVPFSKISHYLYYPFARAILGRSLGHRGVIPAKLKKRREVHRETPTE